MQLVSRRFRRRRCVVGDPTAGWIWTSGKIKIACRFLSMLRLFFDLPRDCRVVWVSLHDCAARKREPFNIQECGESRYPGLHSVDDSFEEISVGQIDHLLEPLVGRKVWMQVEYE